MIRSVLDRLWGTRTGRRRGTAGVVTGCDSATEWMLEWWYGNFRRHNPDLPVCFADFGMSRKMRGWCARRGKVIDLSSVCPAGNRGSAWFKKPRAIAESPYEKVVWLDTDCEVRGSLEGYFAYCDRTSIGLNYDVRTNFNLSHCLGKGGNLITEPFQSGVVVACPDNELVAEWVARCAAGSGARGDQEVLIALIVERIESGNTTTRIRVMPPEYQWLRLQGEPPERAIVVHWTGPAGKERIRQKMAAGHPARDGNR